MKGIFFSFLFALVLTSCGGCSTEKKAESSSATSSSLSAESLNRDQFLQKVYNYQTQGEETVFLGTKPTIVDFYASWCGSCRQLAPILNELLNEYDGKFDLYKVDVDAEQRLAIDFGVEALPTLLFIPLNGKPQFVIGFQSKDAMKGYIKDILKVE